MASVLVQLRGRLDAFEARRDELEKMLAEPDVAKRADYTALLRELGALEKMLQPWREWSDAEGRRLEAEEIVAGDDEEMAELAREELAELEPLLARLEAGILDRLLDEDQVGDRTAIVEIRAGAGGDEAAIFAGDLFRLYLRVAELQHWKIEVMDQSESDMGGFKEITFSVKGEGAFRCLQFESGGHRVQRVPTTESQGRIHTSAATVAVLPEAEEVDFDLKEDELEFQAMRAGGPGGQHVNKTSSAVRVTHIPTGVSVRCQEDKSQHKNRAKAIRLLRARLFEVERQKKAQERADARRDMVGSGDRSQRIRTYNWPQNRVTDHRLGDNFSLEKILAGQLDELFQRLQDADRADKIAAL